MIHKGIINTYDNSLIMYNVFLYAKKCLKNSKQ